MRIVHIQFDNVTKRISPLNVVMSSNDGYLIRFKTMSKLYKIVGPVQRGWS